MLGNSNWPVAFVVADRSSSAHFVCQVNYGVGNHRASVVSDRAAHRAGIAALCVRTERYKEQLEDEDKLENIVPRRKDMRNLRNSWLNVM